MSVIRVAFLGTPEFARYHLESILEDEHFEVVGVVTQPDRPSGRNMRLTPSPVKKLALEKNIPVITPENFRSDEVIKEIHSWRAEAAIVVAFGQILPQKFLDLYPRRVVNVHASLLPRWRGAAPIQRAIQAGDLITGVSLQVMVKKLDAGDVIGTYTLPITAEMNALTLHDALMPLGAKLLAVDFMDYMRGNIMPKPQDENLVTYAHKIEKAESAINWRQDAQSILNHIRSMVMGPGSFTQFGDKKIKIIKAELVKNVSGDAGVVLQVEKDSFLIAAQENGLRILEVQPESRTRMSAKDFLLGHPLNIGDKFISL